MKINIFRIMAIMVMILYSDSSFAQCNTSLKARKLGPFAINNYSTDNQSNGIGRLISLDFDPVDSNVVYVGSGTGGGLYKGVISGSTATWTDLTSNSENTINCQGVSTIAVAKSNSNIIFFGTGNNGNDVGFGTDNAFACFGGRTTSRGLFKTTDGGVTWNKVNLPASADLSYSNSNVNCINKILIHPTKPNIVLVGIGGIKDWANTANDPDMTNWGAIYKTIDGGSSWVKVLGNGGTSNPAASYGTNNSNFILEMCFDPGDDTKIYAGGHRFFMSTDQGATWTDKTGTVIQQTGYLGTGKFVHGNRLMVSPSPSETNTVYITYNFDDWSDPRIDNPPVPKTGSNYIVHHYGLVKYNYGSPGTVTNLTEQPGIGWFFDKLAIDRKNPSYKWATHENSLSYTNGASNFSTLNYTNPVHADGRDIKQNPIDGKIYIVCDGGLYFKKSKTSPVNEWFNLSNGLNIADFLDFDVNESNTDIVGGLQDDGHVWKTSSIETDPWNHVYGGDGTIARFDPNNPNVAYFTTYFNGGTVYKITKTGNVAPFTFPYEFVTPNGSTGGSVSLDFSADGNTIYMGNNDLYKSSTNNISFYSWTNLTASLVPQKPGNLNILRVFKPNPDIIYIGYAEQGRFFKTINGGTTWTEQSWFGTTSGKINCGQVTSILLHPTDPNILWLTTGCYTKENDITQNANIFISIDGGATWSNYSDGLPKNRTFDVVMDDRTPLGTLYVATGVGVYTRNYNNNEASWKCHDKKFTANRYTRLKIKKSTNELFASTFGNGIWKSSLYCESVAASPKFINNTSLIQDKTGMQITSDKIYAAYSSANVSSPLTINSGFGKTSYTAGTSILLGPGFLGDYGSNFTASVVTSLKCANQTNFRKEEDAASSESIREAQVFDMNVNSNSLLFPIPAIDIVNVDTKGLKGEIEMQLFDQKGMKLETYNFVENGANSIDFTFDMRKYPDGVYLYTLIDTASNKQTGRISKGTSQMIKNGEEEEREKMMELYIKYKAKK